MSVFATIGDYWQFRCNRAARRLSEESPARQINSILWQSFKEERLKLIIDNETNNPKEISVLSVQQGPTTTEAYYDWQHMPGFFSHSVRLLAAHASLKNAIAETEADKIIGVTNVNFRELTPGEMYEFCDKLVFWWDKHENTFLSPYSRMSHLIRNWLNGVYKEKPLGSNNSLDAIRENKITNNDIVVFSAQVLLDYILEKFETKPEIAIVGQGAWSEALFVELRSKGLECHLYSDLPDRHFSILVLMCSHNLINDENVDQLNCEYAVEALPEQISPSVDDKLAEKGIFVIPDIICSSGVEVVEDWWIKGRRVPDWKQHLQSRLKEITAELEDIAISEDIHCYHAAFVLALKNLVKRWPQDVI